MTLTQVWQAVEEQASAWRTSPLLAPFAASLPRNAPQRTSGLPGLLQNLEAGGARIASHPMLLGSTVQMWMAALGVSHPSHLEPSWSEWIEEARRIEMAHRRTIAWLRSRLPGYPFFPSPPQLAPGTPLTTDEFSWRLVWTVQERSLGLQFAHAPPQVPDALAATPEIARNIDQTARAVATALQATSEWDRLAAAKASLDGDSRRKLQQVRRTLKERLNSTALQDYAGDLALPRDQYRQAVLGDELQALSGAASEYVEAFDAADRLIELAASDVFGQLSAYRIETFTAPQNLNTEPGSSLSVSFNAAGHLWPAPGMVAWVDDPLIVDAIHVTAVTWNFDIAFGETSRVTGPVLKGTHAAWR